LNPQYCSWN